MRLVYFITHPDVVIDPQVPIPQWPLSQRGHTRMKKLLGREWVNRIDSIYSSSEQKAVDGARILAQHLTLEFQQVETLGEIDRSATGYLPAEEHLTVVNEFFTYPDKSIRGWETANGAQHRISQAIENLLINDKGSWDIAIVSHGTVGALYLCQLLRQPISQRHGQPGTNGGNYYCFEAQSKSLVHGWKPIDN